MKNRRFVNYPYLIAVEYFGDTMLSLDFGTRQFVIEGSGLTELVRYLQQGTVMAIQEHSVEVWQDKQNSGSISVSKRISSAN